MASTLLSNADVEALLNGLPYLDLSGDSMDLLEVYIDANDAAIRELFGDHPTDMTSSDYLNRRIVLIQLIAHDVTNVPDQETRDTIFERLGTPKAWAAF